MSTTAGPSIATETTAVATLHPLDPLSAGEITQAAEIVRRHPAFSARSWFQSITLLEPTKAEIAAIDTGGGPPERLALAVVYDRDTKMLLEFLVSLSNGSVRSLTKRPDMRPGMSFPEFLAAQEAIKADPRWQSAMTARGVTDFEHVQVHPWPPGYNDERDDHGHRRLAKGMTFVGTHAQDNVFARPVEGLVVTVDLDTATVLRVDDDGVVALPLTSANYSPEQLVSPTNTPTLAGPRTDMRPIEIHQPQGPSFVLDGHELSWQKWRLHIGFTSREGIVLHQIRYRDGDRERSVVARASLSEMWVPYGDPAPLHRIKAVFDEGEAGLGRMTNSLRLGCDCLGEIRYLDAVVADHEGKPTVIHNGICIHEEDTGISWKHTHQAGPGPENATVEVRRGRRLVISSFSTVGNYDYGFFWYLHTDGSISYEVKLTGIVSAGAVASGATPQFGTVVAQGVYGPNHQHVFNVRLDMAVDGERNSVYEVDSRPLPSGPDNPLGNAWVAHPTLLADESSAQRVADPSVARTWVIVNEAVRNGLGQPVGYQLVPASATLPLLSADSPAMQRAGFATKHLWVTPYRPTELYAAGAYPYQSERGAGLPTYVAHNESVRDTDIVIWHTFVSHHVVRPEDWPVMPVTTTGLHLRPVGFFDTNPALDLPRPEDLHQHDGHHDHHQ